MRNILVSYFPLYHGISFLKHILAQFYIGKPDPRQENFMITDLIQEEAEQIWDKTKDGFMFDKVIIFTPKRQLFRLMTIMPSRKKTFLIEDEVLKSDPKLLNAWDEVLSKSFDTIEQEVEYIKTNFSDIADKMLKLYWRNIQHYYPDDQIWWLQNLSNLPKSYFKRFEFISIDKIVNYRDYKAITNHIYQLFLKVLQKHKNDRILVNIGLSGQTITIAWFVLAQAGLIPNKVRYFEAYDIKNTRPNHRYQKFYIKQVPTSLLAEVLTDLKLYDYQPTSKLRQIAEQKFHTYLKQGFSILILGERGIGKSYLAKKYSENENLKFVAVNCASFIDSHIAEAELFGYKKGAFTDAKSDKPGLIEEANGGVLFMDEIHTLPKEIQFKLMRAFATDEENRMTIRRLGETKERKIRLKALIFATNRSINELRQVLLPDFFDRIAQLIIELPPLRQTPDEIIPAFKQIWEQLRFNEFYNYEDYPGKDKNLLQWLKTLPLYGNYRDLQKIAINYKTYLDFPPELKQQLPYKSAYVYTKAQYETYLHNIPEHSHNPYFSHNTPIDQILKHFKRDLANWAIHTFGSAQKAAEHFNALGSNITKETLYRWRNAKI